MLRDYLSGYFIKDKLTSTILVKHKKGNHKIPTQNTKYEIGSVTKVFTGILLANAVKEGKINLQDDIRKYLKDSYPNLESENQSVRQFE
jgi:CubicO group peptidase (beta-lactamase class C family)